MAISISYYLVKIGPTITHFSGVPLYLGVVSFEKYGGDPQKRSLKNQLLSFIAMLIIEGMVVTGGILLARIFLGPLGKYAALSYLANRQVINEFYKMIIK